MLKTTSWITAATLLFPAALSAQQPPAPAAPPPAPATMPAAAAAPQPAVQASEPPPPSEPTPLPEIAPNTGVVAAEIAPPAPPPPPEPAPSDFKLEVGGGMILLLSQPLHVAGGGSTKGNAEVFEAKIRLDAEFGMFGLHIVPIVRDSKERDFFPGTTWVQEAYAFAKLGPVQVKAGKVFAQFGRFWDNSFLGNTQEYDGFKLDPNNGLSIEGKYAADQPFGLTYFAQYFLIDGLTNYSLPGRDTPSSGGRRRNYFVGRVEPFVKLGEMTTLKLGVSGGYFDADFQDAMNPTRPWEHVGRVAIDATAMIEHFSAWIEYAHQFGNQLITNPWMLMGGRPYDKADWIMAGAEYTCGRFTFRYNFNMGSYSPLDYSETRHIPGVAVALDEHLFALLEWGLWHSHSAGQTGLLLNNIFLTIHGKV